MTQEKFILQNLKLTLRQLSSDPQRQRGSGRDPPSLKPSHSSTGLPSPFFGLVTYVRARLHSQAAVQCALSMRVHNGSRMAGFQHKSSSSNLAVRPTKMRLQQQQQQLLVKLLPCTGTKIRHFSPSIKHSPRGSVRICITRLHRPQQFFPCPNKTPAVKTGSHHHHQDHTSEPSLMQNKKKEHLSFTLGHRMQR